MQSSSESVYLTTSKEIAMMTAEQMIAAQKANIETLFGLTEKAFSGVEKMVELNMAAAKAAIADSQSQAHAFMNVKDVQELMALQAGYLQPLSEKAVAFSRHVYDIASNTSKEFGHAFEEKAAEAQNSVSKNAPAGSESAMAMMKSAMSASQTAIESVQKAVKQATEAAEANLHAMATTTATASKPVARKR
jgi:phasin family protein